MTLRTSGTLIPVRIPGYSIAHVDCFGLVKFVKLHQPDNFQDKVGVFF